MRDCLGVCGLFTPHLVEALDGGGETGSNTWLSTSSLGAQRFTH